MSFLPHALWSIPCQNALKSKIQLSKGHEIKLLMSLQVLDQILENTILKSFNKEVIKIPFLNLSSRKLSKQRRVNHPKCHQCPDGAVTPYLQDVFLLRSLYYLLTFGTLCGFCKLSRSRKKSLKDQVHAWYK